MPNNAPSKAFPSLLDIYAFKEHGKQHRKAVKERKTVEKKIRHLEREMGDLSQDMEDLQVDKERLDKANQKLLDSIYESQKVGGRQDIREVAFDNWEDYKDQSEREAREIERLRMEGYELSRMRESQNRQKEKLGKEAQKSREAQERLLRR
ncbi:hypothetical protein F53441_4592 [Fusarium austroafricanum]|uniref:Uncharacterized protein n=1 Tax=Fusarium austroafricanum TaxID=2364996 RepID=A0A8H4KMU6_9HYPO|nr:hypothetical protein F53441_4592 [Fusarium austroafricanum]